MAGRSVKHIGRQIAYDGVFPTFPVSAKTANYTVLREDGGTTFTNTGAAGAVTFTLPAVAAVPTGWWAEFNVTADQTVTITAPAGKLIAFNNAAATSIAFSTASEKIGNTVVIKFDGAKYIAQVHLGTETSTPTIS